MKYRDYILAAALAVIIYSLIQAHHWFIDTLVEPIPLEEIPPSRILKPRKIQPIEEKKLLECGNKYSGITQTEQLLECRRQILRQSSLRNEMYRRDV